MRRRRQTDDGPVILSREEREIILTIADDEQSWHVHTDSRRGASTRLRKVAQAWGVEPQKLGAGCEFDLPLKAIRFAGPPSKARRAAGAAAAARMRSRVQNPHSTSGKPEPTL